MINDPTHKWHLLKCGRELKEFLNTSFLLDFCISAYVGQQDRDIENYKSGKIHVRWWEQFQRK